MTSTPVRFCFGVHLHQPVGNFGYVFEQHVRDVYLPLLTYLRDRDFLPVSLHVSGPLIEWLERHDRRFLDVLADLTSRGRVELLLAGFYEPVLAALPRADRVEQIGWMRETLQRLFGVTATGLWLTERVWEPDLTEDLARAGVRFALVDDRHFLVSGFRREQLHAPFWTEHVGERVALFPIDERLRYLVPFQPPADTVAYLRSLRDAGHRLAVLADDGEKFGGWPGTREWVYEKGWLDQFIAAIQDAAGRGDVELSTLEAALHHVPSGGLAYLSTASYREMEAWSLPTEATLRLAALEETLGPVRVAGGDGALLRGSHWRNFLVKYREANRMHKKMLALSALCRAHGDPAPARRAIGRAQCNDAYWHGVFGGLYLPFLRAAVWEHLAEAEEALRDGEPLVCEELDIDYDGYTELWVHSASFSAIVSPARGGAIEELTRFAQRVNLANALTRRREAYHVVAAAAEQRPDEATTGGAAATADGHATGNDSSARGDLAPGAVHTSTAIADQLAAPPGDPALSDAPGERAAPSIHDLEHRLRLDVLPPIDLNDRSIFIERVVSSSVTAQTYEQAAYTPVASAAGVAMSYRIRAEADSIAIELHVADGSFEKTIWFFADGRVRVRFVWQASLFAESDWFTTELSLDAGRRLLVSAGGDVWSHRIETVAKSERGLDRTLQGIAYLVRWPVTLGAGDVDIPVAS